MQVDELTIAKTAAIIGAVIGGAFTLLGVALGFAIQRFDRHWDDIEQFRMTKALIIATPTKTFLYPRLYPYLRRLRRFFIKHPKYYNQKKENKEFFDKWLANNPILETNVTHTWGDDSWVDELQADLSKVDVWLFHRSIF